MREAKGICTKDTLMETLYDDTTGSRISAVEENVFQLCMPSFASIFKIHLNIRALLQEIQRENNDFRLLFSVHENSFSVASVFFSLFHFRLA